MSVYTPIEKDDLEALAAKFGLGAIVSSSPVEGGIENTNYFLQTGEGRFVLTLHERDRAERVEAVLALSSMLKTSGVPLAEFIKTPLGSFSVAHKDRPVSISRFVDGIQTDKPGDVKLQRLGETLAQFHLAGASVGDELEDGPHLARVLCPLAERWAERTRHRQPEFYDLLRWEENHQRGVPEAGLPSGLLHADLFLDNVIFAKEGEGVAALLDLHMMGRGPWLYDLAVLVSDAAWSGQGLNGNLARAVLSGYRSVRPMESVELALLPEYLRRAALRFLCLRLERADLESEPRRIGKVKEPFEQAEKLRKFQGLS